MTILLRGEKGGDKLSGKATRTGFIGPIEVP